MSSAATSSLVGLVVVRGAGAAPVHRKLPRRSTASVGRRERFAFDLRPEWVPRDLGTFIPVEEGWLFLNLSRDWMRLESDFILNGFAVFRPRAMTMLQRGDHRISWDGLDRPVGVSVQVRTRRLDDQRIPYAVDSTLEGQVEGGGSYLGVTDAPMSAALRHRLAVLFRHLIEGEPEPRNLVEKRAEQLGLSQEELESAAHRYRRRLNAVHSLDLQTVAELGEYLVSKSNELTGQDLDP